MDNSKYSCALVDGKILGHDSPQNSQKQSLFARSAALQKQQKNLAAVANSERTLIVDFDSSVADDNNTFVCPTRAYTKLIGSGSMRNDEQRNKSRFGEAPSLYGTIPLKGHFTNTSIIARHRLLFAHINAREYKLVRDAEQKSCSELLQLVCACSINPETHLGAAPSHTFAISEKFCIDDCNQTLSVESNRSARPFVLPKTKTGIKSIECLTPEAVQCYFDNNGCKDLICAALHLRFQTCEPHHFVPGIKFALLNTSNLVEDNNNVSAEYINTYTTCPALATLLAGETTVYEVYDVLTDYCFLAVPVAKKLLSNNCDDCPAPCDTTPWRNSVIASTMFKRSLYQRVYRDHLIVKGQEEQCCNGGNAVAYGRFVAGCCGVAVAYIPCATSPQQLACFVGQLAEASIHAGIDTSVQQVTYDALQDEFTVKFFPPCVDDEPIVRRTKNLLGAVDQYSTISLSRNAMLATANCPEAKELYLQRALRGAFYFKIETDINDRFTLFIYVSECREVRKRTIALAAGLYKSSEFVACLSEQLNHAVECERECFQFQVDFTLHPTEGLLAWQQCGIGASAKQQQQNFPMLGTSPYESQTFGIMISNTQNHKFALQFPAQIAATLDFDSRQTEFATSIGSRSLAGIVDLMRCADNCAATSKCPPCKTPTIRASYSANVDRCTALVTIEQKSLPPLYCNSLRASVLFCRDKACCEDGPDNAIDFPCTDKKCVECDYNDSSSDASKEIDATLFDNCCDTTTTTTTCPKQDSDSENNDSNGCECEKQKRKCCDKCRSYIVLQMPNTACEPAILPLLAGDVVWLQYNNCRTFGACVAYVWRDCHPVPCTNAARFKVALDYKADGLYSDLTGLPTPECLPPCLPVTLRFEAIGFNLHMNPAVTEKPMLDSSLPTTHFSAQSAVSRWFGFRNAATLSCRRYYTSDSCIQSLLDERLILRIPELDGFGSKQPRYGVMSPLDTVLTRHYGVLTLDRPSGVYKYDNSTDSLTGFLELHRCTASETCAGGFPAVGTSGNSTKQGLSFHLLRSDGSAYTSCGDTLVASVEICYSN